MLICFECLSLLLSPRSSVTLTVYPEQQHSPPRPYEDRPNTHNIMSLVIVNADDLGFSERRNYGILQAYKRYVGGILIVHVRYRVDITR